MARRVERLIHLLPCPAMRPAMPYPIARGVPGIFANRFALLRVLGLRFSFKVARRHCKVEMLLDKCNDCELLGDRGGFHFCNGSSRPSRIVTVMSSSRVPT